METCFIMLHFIETHKREKQEKNETEARKVKSKIEEKETESRKIKEFGELRTLNLNI